MDRYFCVRIKHAVNAKTDDEIVLFRIEMNVAGALHHGVFENIIDYR